MVVDLPSALRVGAANFRLLAQTGGAGRGLDGREQLIFSENRVWIGEIAFAAMTRAEAMLAQAVGDELAGRSGVLRVPVDNSGTLTFAGDLSAFLGAAGVPEGASGVPFSDGSTFSDGSSYALPSPDEPTVQIAVAAGSQSLTASGFLAATLAVGAVFSVNDFLYRVAANDAGNLRFNPPLRKDVAAGTVLQVSNPSIRVHLAEDDGWAAALDLAAIGQPFRVNVVEAFDR